ncbi:MAG: ABC transporter permease subunit, partial [Bacillota bacterium]|nr:ABC transporter permease subunit [Bacillota bacterium]
MKKKLINTDKWPTILLVSFGLILWQLLVSFEFVEAYVLPAPSQILIQLLMEREVLWQHLLVTLQEAGIGFLLAIVLAFVLNLLMELLPVIKKALYPVLIMSQTIPIIVLAPLFGLWFGFGILPKIVIVVLVCFFPIVVSLSDATATVDEDMIHLVES